MKTLHNILFAISLICFANISQGMEQSTSWQKPFEQDVITSGLDRHDKIRLLNHFIYEGNLGMVKKLLTVRSGCNEKDLNSPDLMGVYPWQSVKENITEENKENKKAIEKLLVAHGAKTNIVPTKLPLLHNAVYRGNINGVKSLLARDTRAQLSTLGSKGSFAPLFIALWNKDPEMVQLLLKLGADKDFAGNARYRFTPLYEATRFGNTKLVEFLLDNSENPNKGAKNPGAKGEYTPLSVAARKNHLESMRLLLNAGADVNQPNEDGQTPLSLAEQFGNAEAAKLLRQYGAQ